MTSLHYITLRLALTQLEINMHHLRGAMQYRQAMSTIH